MVAEPGGNFPFKQIKRDSEYFCRTFSANVDESELVWHRDHEDRYVQVISGAGWQLQMDNELPFEMIHGETYFIPKNTHHRIIKGKEPLIIGIREVS